jgi:acyl-CoA synthetase (NDP forming)
VRLNLTTAAEVQDAFRAIHASTADPASADESDGVLIQPMAADAVETIVGVTVDPLFGRWSDSDSGVRRWKFSVTCGSASRP